MKYKLLKPGLFRMELLSHESNLRPADEVLQSITETLFNHAIQQKRKVRVYIRVEYEGAATQGDTE